MPEKIKVKIQRVEAGDEMRKPVAVDGFVHGVVPVAGFVVQIDGSCSVPLYVRDSDLERAKDLRERKGKSIAIDAVSWQGGKG